MDQGAIEIGVPASFIAEGEFTDTVEFELDLQEDITLTVSGFSHTTCTGGRGANCLYKLCDITVAPTLLDANDVEVGAWVESTGVGYGNGRYNIWTCLLPALAAGTYMLEISGNAHQHTKIPGSDRPAEEPYYVALTAP